MAAKISIKNILLILVVLLIGLGIYSEVSTDNPYKETATPETAILESVEEESVENDDSKEVEILVEEVLEVKVPVQKEVLPVEKMVPVFVIDIEELDPNMVLVTYSDFGFIPPVVEVVAGGTIKFINTSSKPMRVTSENHPTANAQIYPGFRQEKSVATGGTYTFSFTKAGVWGYSNLNAEKHLGTVSVIAQ